MKKSSLAHAAFVIVLSTIFPALSFAFPEMVRDGYANCTACHVSPNGGGVLTPYGRSLSQELLSTWGKPNESDFAYGLIKPPEWLNLGGDVRVLQFWQKTDAAELAQFVFMQADLEAAATFGKFQAVVSVGPQPSMTVNHAGGAIFSREHYILYHPTDKINLRAGKFDAAYGINTPEHKLPIKAGLGWDEESETYNVEASYLGDNFDAYATILLGRPDAPNLELEKGVSLRSSYLLKQTSKIGLSYYYGTNDLANRHVFGPYGILGITPHFFILAEWDLQYRLPGGSDPTWGCVDYIRVDYEFIKGLHGYVDQQLTKLDWTSPNTTTTTYGIGVQFFPRPHFDFQLELQKTNNPMMFQDWQSVAWAMGHYYL